MLKRIAMMVAVLVTAMGVFSRLAQASLQPDDPVLAFPPRPSSGAR